MILTKATKRNIVFFVSAFLLCGVLCVLLHGMDFAICFSQLFCCVLTLFWVISVQKRISDSRLCSLMLWIAVFLLLEFILQICRYELFNEDITVQRYLWYVMYIPMMAQPLLCFFLAVFIHRPSDKPLPRIYYLFIVIGVLLVIGFLTNDLHFWGKSFPSGILDDNGQEKSGWLYYLIQLFIYVLYAFALAIILKKNHRYVAWKYRWIVVVPFLIGVGYFVVYPFDIGHRFFDTRLWQIGEMMGFCIIGALEACIQTGMIPANRGYEKLFYVADLPAAILDNSGKPVYQTLGTQYPFLPSEEAKIVSHPIKGGSMEYLVDMKRVQELNQKLAERAKQIETRNAYIAGETRIKQELTELETRNRLYERISSIVSPQLGQIDALVNASKHCGEKELARIAVLKAYIKRRSNMELLVAAGTLTVVELASAVTESLEYIRLYGVNTAVSSVGTGSFSAEMVIAAYEKIEEITEESLDTLSDMIVAIRSAGQHLSVRIMLKAENFSYANNGVKQESVVGFSRSVSITKENQDMIIVLTFTEGGGRK